ncbi:MAG: hypothetical protein ACPG7F_19425 [Aggregatilineales bacterium]
MLDIRFRLIMITLIGLLVAGIWTLPRWYPLLSEEEVIDAFPGLAQEFQMEFVSLPRNQQNAYLEIYNGNADDEIPPRPDLATALVVTRLTGEDVLVQEDVPFAVPAGSTIARSGTFTTVDAVRIARGEVTIYGLPDQNRVLRLGDEFFVTLLPGTELIFTRNPDPYDARGVGVDYISMGRIQGNAGGQTYIVPASVNFSVYPILALYVPEYDYVLSTATLR